MDETARQLGEADDDQAALDRTRERTLRESRAGVEAPTIEAAPVVDFRARPVSAPSAGTPEVSVSRDRSIPDGYTIGAYLGSMQRAPPTSASDSEPSSNPKWLGSAFAHDAILDRAGRSGCAFSCAVLRVLPGTDVQALDRSLEALDSPVEGSTGAYVRIRVPPERGRFEAIVGLAGVLGVGAIRPRLKAEEAFVQEMRSRSGSDALPVYITLMASDPSGEWRRALSGLGVVAGAYDSDLRSYTANLPAAAVAPVLAADFVLSVEPVPVVAATVSTAGSACTPAQVRNPSGGLAAQFGAQPGVGAIVVAVSDGEPDSCAFRSNQLFRHKFRERDRDRTAWTPGSSMARRSAPRWVRWASIPDRSTALKLSPSKPASGFVWGQFSVIGVAGAQREPLKPDWRVCLLRQAQPRPAPPRGSRRRAR